MIRMRYDMRHSCGFSLVELSIVLVILGLLTGGILAGQSLIRASELRAVTSEYQRYVAAVQTFRDKYFAIPGDMTNATKFWGDDNAACPDAAIPNGTPGTCNGTGNGFLGAAGAVNATGEVFQFWKQLALAGLVEGSYTGLAGPAGSGWDNVIGTNAPRSKLGNAGWGVYDWSNSGGGTTFYAFDYGNMLTFGTIIVGSISVNPALKAEEAWNIDTKMDDGRPGAGKALMYSSAVWGNANACSLGANNTDYSAAYNLASSTINCAFMFAKPF